MNHDQTAARQKQNRTRWQALEHVKQLRKQWPDKSIIEHVWYAHPHNGALPFSVVLLYCNTAPRVLHFSALVVCGFGLRF